MKYSIAEAFQDLEMIKTESPIYEESETKDITFKFPEGSLNIGQKIKYGTKVYTIIDLEWNDKYGYDIEIDKIDSRGDLGVWIGNGNHNVEVVDDKIEESVEDNKLHEDKFSLTNKVETEEAKEVLEEEPVEQVEMVIDTEAETPEDLKYSYVGNYILECPTCHALLYKKPEDLVKSEDSEYYNDDQKCPHCNSSEGYMLVGIVAPTPTDANGNEPSEETKPEDLPITKEEDKTVKVKETEETEEEETEITPPPTRESIEKDEYEEVIIESLDDDVFNKLVTNYLVETYNNVKSFTTVEGSVNDRENTIKLNGIIEFNSGKKLNTSFIFEAKEITKRGLVRMFGLNESFSKSKNAFMLTGKVVDNKFMCESLTYNYKGKDAATNNTQKIYGRVVK